METQTAINDSIRSSIRAFAPLIFGMVLSTAPLALAVAGPWTAKTDLPTARGFLSPVSPVIDGKVYVIGGGHGSAVYRSLEAYDPTTDTWAQKADMPTARWSLGTCAVNGKIYAIGGVPGYTGPACSIVEEYDPSADTWARKADMPTRRVGGAVCTVAGKIYVLGGGLSEPLDSAISTVELYDPVTNTWTQRANMPSPRAYFSAEAVNGKIYAIGGTYTSPWIGLSTVEVYDPATDTWSSRAPMPTGRWWHATCVVGGRIYAIGGTQANPWSGLSATECYDPAADIWTKEPSMPTPRLSLSVAAIEARIYAIGGVAVPYPWPTSVSTVEVCDLTPPPPDFNGDGQVDIKDLLRLIESWGQSDPVADVAPIPFGDGTVDRADLEVLMSHWQEQPRDVTLLSHWALDEAEGIIAFDSVGNHHAEAIGDPLWQPDGGVVGGALELNGATFVTADVVLSPTDGPFSVLAWIKGGAPGETILSQEGGADWLLLDAVTEAFMTELRSGGRQSKPLHSEAVIADDAWHRIGFTWDGSHRRLYVDNLLVAEDTDVSLSECYGGLNIGCGKLMAPSTFFTGLIDDVRIYNRAVKP
ncbi:MAG: hypothetical protein JW741_19700 [Sedimentisphaerales bacterium]|nr:hypothetical protein [Sedimentisphaerales bacterium]